MRLRGMIFDLDGTLGDTLPVNFAAYRNTFERFTGRIYSDAEIEAMFGPNEEGILQRLIQKPMEEFLPVFLSEYERSHGDCAKPFPGIIPALELLKERRVPMAIVTGKGAGSLAISLRFLGIGEFFSELETGSMEGGIKPISIERVLNKWGVPRNQVGYVGDAAYDMEAARDAGVMSLAAAWAESANIELLRSRNPDRLFRTTEEFVHWIRECVEAE